MSIAEYQYLNFVRAVYPPSAKRRTLTWFMTSKDGKHLGIIRWFGRWRQYVFEPEAGTVWSCGCLSDVISFIEQHKGDRERLLEFGREE